MGLFGKLFGKKSDNKESKENNTPENDGNEIFYAKQDKTMEAAYTQAQQTFKYFWRELYWEYKRIVPAHNLAIVKIPFKQKFDDLAEPVVEHMWINQIYFDGENITGILMNSPNQLTNIAIEDKVSVKLEDISDWLLAIQGKTYGGFTIQLLRSKMQQNERKQHDQAWGLDFGDCNDIQLVYKQKQQPENLIEHPMSKNMKEKMQEFLQQNPEEITEADETGTNMLHRETIAGNKTAIAILLELGADKTTKNNKGKTALDYAKEFNWEHIIPVLE